MVSNKNIGIKQRAAVSERDKKNVEHPPPGRCGLANVPPPRQIFSQGEGAEEGKKKIGEKRGVHINWCSNLAYAYVLGEKKGRNSFWQISAK